MFKGNPLATYAAPLMKQKPYESVLNKENGTFDVTITEVEGSVIKVSPSMGDADGKGLAGFLAPQQGAVALDAPAKSPYAGFLDAVKHNTAVHVAYLLPNKQRHACTVLPGASIPSRELSDGDISRIRVPRLTRGFSIIDIINRISNGASQQAQHAAYQAASAMYFAPQVGGGGGGGYGLPSHMMGAVAMHGHHAAPEGVVMGGPSLGRFPPPPPSQYGLPAAAHPLAQLGGDAKRQRVEPPPHVPYMPPYPPHQPPNYHQQPHHDYAPRDRYNEHRGPDR